MPRDENARSPEARKAIVVRSHRLAQLLRDGGDVLDALFAGQGEPYRVVESSLHFPLTLKQVFRNVWGLVEAGRVDLSKLPRPEDLVRLTMPAKLVPKVLRVLSASPDVEGASLAGVYRSPVGRGRGGRQGHGRALAVAASARATTYPQPWLDSASEGGLGFRNAQGWGPNGGSGVTVCVLDDGFQAHVDLPSFSRDYGSPGPNAQTVHGPWTLGILFAKHDAKGVEGTVPAATPAFCYSEDADLGETLASQLELAVAELLPGDVFLVESVGAGGLPAEEADDVKLVFRLAEAKGIHVVEPAGNVEENLDSQEYEGRYKEGPDDSGAILVTGAVERCHDIGCYGARVDCFAWSSDVATTSTGNGYKLNHGGTSSASAMTAGAIAFASAYAKQKHGRTILPRTLRKMVNQHGTAKKAGQPKIGRQPDVAKLLKKIDPLGNADFFPQP